MGDDPSKRFVEGTGLRPLPDEPGLSAVLAGECAWSPPRAVSVLLDFRPSAATLGLKAFSGVNGHSHTVGGEPDHVIRDDVASAIRAGPIAILGARGSLV